VSSLFPELYLLLLEQLVAARKKAGLTQVEVANALKKPQSFVSKYESGERLLDVAEFLEIARILGADPLKMLGKRRR
jgi:transcriptional regulator with XRE-family HTH domain